MALLLSPLEMDRFSMEELHGMLHFFTLLQLDQQYHNIQQLTSTELRKFPRPYFPNITLQITNEQVVEDKISLEIESFGGKCPPICVLAFAPKRKIPIWFQRVPTDSTIVSFAAPMESDFFVVALSTCCTVGRMGFASLTISGDQLERTVANQSDMDDLNAGVQMWVNQHYRETLVHLVRQLPSIEVLRDYLKCLKNSQVATTTDNTPAKGSEEYLDNRGFRPAQLHVYTRRARLQHPPNMNAMGWKEVYLWYCMQYKVTPIPEVYVQLPEMYYEDLLQLIVPSRNFGPNGIGPITELIRHAPLLTTLKFKSGSLTLSDASWVSDAYNNTPEIHCRISIEDLLIQSQIECETHSDSQVYFAGIEQVRIVVPQQQDTPPGEFSDDEHNDETPAGLETSTSVVHQADMPEIDQFRSNSQSWCLDEVNALIDASSEDEPNSPTAVECSDIVEGSAQYAHTVPTKYDKTHQFFDVDDEEEEMNTDDVEIYEEKMPMTNAAQDDGNDEEDEVHRTGDKCTENVVGIR
eukprot:TRINITY_DN59525_c0_g1_i1.p1 TRINITY_DN59525_c0_g1~~TRINITY_DN59525_c0_g1_i1.p1  ORF type:complete len:522 (+),score=35.52 TRINITY_DN59525_c0_g1_i1:47-1612(+)